MNLRSTTRTRNRPRLGARRDVDVDVDVDVGVGVGAGAGAVEAPVERVHGLQTQMTTTKMQRLLTMNLRATTRSTT